MCQLSQYLNFQKWYLAQQFYISKSKLVLVFFLKVAIKKLIILDGSQITLFSIMHITQIALFQILLLKNRVILNLKSKLVLISFQKYRLKSQLFWVNYRQLHCFKQCILYKLHYFKQYCLKKACTSFLYLQIFSLFLFSCFSVFSSKCYFYNFEYMMHVVFFFFFLLFQLQEKGIEGRIYFKNQKKNLKYLDVRKYIHTQCIYFNFFFSIFQREQYIGHLLVYIYFWGLVLLFGWDIYWEFKFDGLCEELDFVLYELGIWYLMMWIMRANLFG
eukprot:TRINITY_DN11496_c0_g1_i7.p3 TRINITY_DN11496_c0_g1~~TRINITY_DN11496_c0_g1_i7.p3  ORF type:complete len:273 (+),score=-4.75 TRINITY_DN11496_c0_g1_i7:471-1289(+)